MDCFPKKSAPMKMLPLLLIIWISSLASLVEAFSVIGKSEESKVVLSIDPSCRRKVVARLVGSLAISGGIAVMAPAISHAACLMGDTSEDCIGIYKMPLDDEVLPYVDTAEKLNKFAPGIRWVPPVEYPKSYRDARTEMLSLRDSASNLKEIVIKGLFVDAGSRLLSLIPRVTVAGRVMIQTLEATKGTNEDLSMRALRLEAAHTELLGKLGQCDIIVGQALSGQLGSTTFAQIQILGELQEADVLFDELIRAIPDSYSGQEGKYR